MITEDYVSYETAKLLKEKGFDVSEIDAYFPFVYYANGKMDFYDDDNPLFVCEAITLQMAMKWLRNEKYYYIQVMLDGWACGGHSGYYVVIQKTDSNFEMMLQDAVDDVFYQTYEEAVESAIKYCLENLI